MLQFNKWKEASQGDHYQEMIHRLLHLVHSQKQPALSLELSNLLTNLQQPPPSSLSEPSLLFLFNVYTWLNYVPPIKVVTIKDDGEEEVEEEDDLSYSDTHLQTLVRLTGHLAMS